MRGRDRKEDERGECEREGEVKMDMKNRRREGANEREVRKLKNGKR